MENGITPTYNLAEHNGYGYDGFGNGGMFLFAIIALLAFGGGGFFGNNRGYSGLEANNINEHTTMVSAFNQLQDENTAIMNNSQRVATELQTSIYNASYNNLAEVKTLEQNVATGFGDMQRCCCDIQRNIDGVNYNGAINTAAINANTTAQVQKVLDAISANKISDLQSQVNQLQLAQATQNVVRYPNAFTFNSPNPFFNGFGFGGPQNNI